MAISFGAIGEKYVTFLAGASAEDGKLCKVTANGTVGKCAANDAFCGVITQVRGGTASVLMGGYVELPYTGAAPSLGFCALAAGGADCVKAAEGGREYLVVNVDTTAKTVGLFL